MASNTTALQPEFNPAAIFGDALRKALFVNAILGICAGAVLLYMCATIVSFYFERPKEARKGTAYMLWSIAIVITYIAASVLDTYHCHEILFRATSPVHFYELFFPKEVSWNRRLSVGCLVTCIAIGDAMLLYRCFIIWTDKQWIIALPTMLWLASIGMGFEGVTIGTKVAVSTAWTISCVLVNISATGLITFRLFGASRRVQSTMPYRKVNLYSRLASMLIESAAPASVFGIAVAVLTALPVSEDLGSVIRMNTANLIFSAFYFAFVAIAPMGIILRVASGRSTVSSLSADVVSRSITFARSPRGPTSPTDSDLDHMDDDLESIGDSNSTRRPSASTQGNTLPTESDAGSREEHVHPSSSGKGEPQMQERVETDLVWLEAERRRFNIA